MPDDITDVAMTAGAALLLLAVLILVGNSIAGAVTTTQQAPEANKISPITHDSTNTTVAFDELGVNGTVTSIEEVFNGSNANSLAFTVDYENETFSYDPGNLSDGDTVVIDFKFRPAAGETFQTDEEFTYDGNNQTEATFEVTSSASNTEITAGGGTTTAESVDGKTVTFNASSISLSSGDQANLQYEATYQGGSSGAFFDGLFTTIAAALSLAVVSVLVFVASFLTEIFRSSGR